MAGQKDVGAYSENDTTIMVVQYDTDHDVHIRTSHVPRRNKNKTTMTLYCTHEVMT